MSAKVRTATANSLAYTGCFQRGFATRGKEKSNGKPEKIDWL